MLWKMQCKKNRHKYFWKRISRSVNNNKIILAENITALIYL